MPAGTEEPPTPSRARWIVSAILVLILFWAVWKVIDYRQQPPPPPHKVGEFAQ